MSHVCHKNKNNHRSPSLDPMRGKANEIPRHHQLLHRMLHFHHRILQCLFRYRSRFSRWNCKLFESPDGFESLPQNGNPGAQSQFLIWGLCCLKLNFLVCLRVYLGHGLDCIFDLLVFPFPLIWKDAFQCGHKRPDFFQLCLPFSWLSIFCVHTWKCHWLSRTRGKEIISKEALAMWPSLCADFAQLVVNFHLHLGTLGWHSLHTARWPRCNRHLQRQRCAWTWTWWWQHLWSSSSLGCRRSSSWNLGCWPLVNLISSLHWPLDILLGRRRQRPWHCHVKTFTSAAAGGSAQSLRRMLSIQSCLRHLLDCLQVHDFLLIVNVIFSFCIILLPCLQLLCSLALALLTIFIIIIFIMLILFKQFLLLFCHRDQKQKHESMDCEWEWIVDNMYCSAILVVTR